MSLLLPANRVTVFSYYGAPVITNAVASRVASKYMPLEIDLVIHSNGTIELGTISPHFNSCRLCHMGIWDTSLKERFDPGKFVYMEDGTFFLFHPIATHKDVADQSLICLDGKAVAPKSAGFFIIEGDKIDFYGDSFSLDMLKPLGDKSDRTAVINHLKKWVNPNQHELFAATTMRD